LTLHRFPETIGGILLNHAGISGVCAGSFWSVQNETSNWLGGCRPCRNYGVLSPG
jgi:hypothetical protein